MGLTKGQPGDLHQYFCRVLEQIASSFSGVDLRWCVGRPPTRGDPGSQCRKYSRRYSGGGAQAGYPIDDQREAACEIIAGAAVEGTQQHAEQIKLGNVYCKCGLFLDVGVRPARRGTPHSTE